MAEKALYILAGYDAESDKRLSELQNKLYEQGFSGEHTKDIPQHITLGSYPNEKEGALIEQMRKIAESGKLVEVALNHVGVFPGAKVLFVAPDINRELLELKESFGESSDVFDWTPHTTMLIDEPETIYKALPSVMESFVPFKGKIAVLHLYEFFPTRHILSVKIGE